MEVLGYATAGLEGSRMAQPTWLVGCDFEAHSGRGEAVFTHNIKQAMRFANFDDAFAYWRTIPRSRPRRPDGKPNRPLTAFHMNIADETSEPMLNVPKGTK